MLKEMQVLGQMVEIAIGRTPLFWNDWRLHVRNSFEFGLVRSSVINEHNHSSIVNDLSYLSSIFMDEAKDAWQGADKMFSEMKFRFRDGVYRKSSDEQFYDEVVRPRALVGLIIEYSGFYEFLKEHTTREWKQSPALAALISARLCESTPFRDLVAPEVAHLAARGEATLALVLERLVARSRALSRFVAAHEGAIERELRETYRGCFEMVDHKVDYKVDCKVDCKVGL